MYAEHYNTIFVEMPWWDDTIYFLHRDGFGQTIWGMVFELFLVTQLPAWHSKTGLSTFLTMVQEFKKRHIWYIFLSEQIKLTNIYSLFHHYSSHWGHVASDIYAVFLARISKDIPYLFSCSPQYGLNSFILEPSQCMSVRSCVSSKMLSSLRLHISGICFTLKMLRSMKVPRRITAQSRA